MPTFSFSYDPREFYQVNRVTQRLTGSRQRWFILAMCAALVVVYIGLPTLSGTFNWSLVNFIPLAVTLVLLLAVGPLATWYAAKTLPRRSPSLQGPQERVLSSDGFQVRGRGAVTSFEWSAIQRAVETKRTFLFFFNQKQAHYLPKRAIPTSADLEQVRTLLRERLGARFEQMGANGAA